MSIEYSTHSILQLCWRVGKAGGRPAITIQAWTSSSGRTDNSSRPTGASSAIRSRTRVSGYFKFPPITTHTETMIVRRRRDLSANYNCRSLQYKKEKQGCLKAQAWRCHGVDWFTVSLAICAGNPLMKRGRTGYCEFPTHMTSNVCKFGDFLVVSLDSLINNEMRHINAEMTSTWWFIWRWAYMKILSCFVLRFIGLWKRVALGWVFWTIGFLFLQVTCV